VSSEAVIMIVVHCVDLSCDSTLCSEKNVHTHIFFHISISDA